MARLRLRGIRKSFKAVEVLHGVDLDIDDREFVVFVGPSGCGKSTLLRLIAGLDPITGGDFHLNDRHMNAVPPARRGIAMVFQSYALYPHMSVYENMSFALRLARRPKAEIDARVAEAARMLQLSPLLQRKPRELSGGQRQRVAIGRAIVRQPQVFLFDEPLSNLDAALRSEVRLEIAKLHRALGATMIYVTHDQIEAMTLADRIVVMNEGRVEQVGTPVELFERPQNTFVATFIGSPRMTMLEVELADGRAGLEGAGQVPAAAADGRRGPAILGVRPDGFRIVAQADGDGFGGVVVNREYLGDDAYLYVRLDDGSQATVRVPPGLPVAPDERMTLSVDAGAAHFFDSTTGQRISA